ncbi:MAG: hypothetical protein Q8M15_16975 [Bacteroidota bacterium]|nr:hypothetical protein [Bacteroidota bacterium]
MEEQHEKENTKEKNIESSEGQRILSCCNEGISRCPSLEYKYVESSGDKVNKAFDLLFEEVMKLNGKLIDKEN